MTTGALTRWAGAGAAVVVVVGSPSRSPVLGARSATTNGDVVGTGATVVGGGVVVVVVVVVDVVAVAPVASNVTARPGRAPPDGGIRPARPTR